ncbi:hypothetical protein BD410DRAFT_798357 [Rickenella mellea]|uniref:Uncharacterized protein n=1 Tax=Rickenella mellea TaxID=50990 RepID=A0A4V3AZP1_9AGAM|nr:hypothetical protein BD410DRAFT_798357 [Rickenella mellea]
MLLRAYLSFLLSGLVLVMAVPSWDGGLVTQPRMSIDSIVPGSDYLEARSTYRINPYVPRFLGSSSPQGIPGNVTILEGQYPLIWYTNSGKLFQLNNSTSVMYVNVMNVTGTAPIGLKLELGNKAKGVRGGTWSYRGTMLWYELGKKTNYGLFYSCFDKDGYMGVYITMDP